MSEMIDRAGDAFLATLGSCVRTSGPDRAPERGTVIIEACILRSQFDKAMRAAIAAMREPTPGMIRCGCGWGMGLADAEVIAGWHAMIAEVLR